MESNACVGDVRLDGLHFAQSFIYLLYWLFKELNRLGNMKNENMELPSFLYILAKKIFK